jgi:hypothetical protein
MLAQLGRLPVPPARVYLPTGTIQAEEQVLAAARAVFGHRMRVVAQRDFPLPQQVTQDPAVLRLIEDGVVPLTRRGTRYTWRLTVWCCQPR